MNITKACVIECHTCEELGISHLIASIDILTIPWMHNTTPGTVSKEQGIGAGHNSRR